MERFNLKTFNKVREKEQYRVEVSNRLAALEDLDTRVKINSAWETIRENMQIEVHKAEPLVSGLSRLLLKLLFQS
jgi:hypothetical protein